jgi:hypothetical protein
MKDSVAKRIIQRMNEQKRQKIAESLFDVISDYCDDMRDVDPNIQPPSQADVQKLVDRTFKSYDDEKVFMTKTAESMKEKLRNGQSIIHG